MFIVTVMLMAESQAAASTKMAPPRFEAELPTKLVEWMYKMPEDMQTEPPS
jgi:hypothetical protein